MLSELLVDWPAEEQAGIAVMLTRLATVLDSSGPVASH
jgi:hypothetical protein